MQGFGKEKGRKNNNAHVEKQLDAEVTDHLQFSKQMYRWIDMYNRNLVVVCDHSGRVIFASKSIKPKLGYEPGQVIGKRWDELIPPADAQYIKEITRNKSINWNNHGFNISIRSSKDKYIWFHCMLDIIYDEEQDNYMYFVTLDDTYTQLESQEMLVRSEKMTIAGQLAAGIAHEIRNPLTSLKGFLQILQSGVNQKDVYYNIMIEEVEKLEAITSELLFISKPLTNEKKLESIDSMIYDVVVLLKSQAKLKGIDLKWTEGKDLYVSCDRSQLKQVLLNLVKNAIEAMDLSGMVTIVPRKKESYIEIDVIDEGQGIADEIIHKINEPFFTTKKSGTGLGLMISKQILEQHYGQLVIINNENKGCTFRMILPVIKE